MNQNQQKRLSEEFVSLYDKRPQNSDLIALDGRVWKYVSQALTGGVWMDLGEQAILPGIDLALTEHVAVTLPPEKLIAMLLKAKAPVNEITSQELTNAILAILVMAGWEHPDSACGEPIPGKIYVSDPKWTMPDSVDPFLLSYTGCSMVHTDDLRPAMALLSDPEVKTLLVKDSEGVYRWFDLNGQTVKLVPDQKVKDETPGTQS